MSLYNIKFNENIRRKLRKESTPQEIILWSRLKNRQLGFKFHRQYGIEHFIVDFCCSKQKLIIEIDGSQHIDDVKDIDRDKILESLGFKVLRFWNSDINKNLEAVIARIKENLASPNFF